VSHRLAIESMHAVVDMKPQSDEHSAIRQCAGNPQTTTVIEAVACAADMTAPPILPAHGGPPRMLSAWLGWWEGMRMLREIAAALRLRSTGNISYLIRRCDRELTHDAVSLSFVMTPTAVADAASPCGRIPSPRETKTRHNLLP
jgi:hypothetical protein